MKKIFLYLYPIQEYNRSFEFSEEYLQQMGRENPYKVLNECIQKRYREKGYQIVYTIYLDKNIYGIKPLPTDKIIYTDVTFEQASGYNKDGSEKQDEDIKYPSERYLIEQLGDFDEIVVGGFHFGDCVKRVAEYCYQCGISTIVDLDLTDLFLLDIKHINSEKCKNLVGVSNKKELDFAKYLSDLGKPMWIRQVLIPGYTDDENDLIELKNFI